MTHSGSAAPAPADKSLAIDDVTGSWAVGTAGPGSRCTVALGRLGDGPHRPALAENCSGGPFAASRSWRLAGPAFELLDASDRPIARFSPAGEDRFRSADGVYQLSRAPLA